jgi:formate--tetrahydrofolate ligase
MDMNDRAIALDRQLAWRHRQRLPREDGFDITVASEVMAIFCLSTDLEDLQNRLGQSSSGYTAQPHSHTARDFTPTAP